MRQRERLLVVDFSNQVYKATAAFQGLTSGRTFTGGLYGFLIAIWKAVEACDANRIIVAGDARPYVRSLEYPEYKANRNKKEKTEKEELLIMAYKQSAKLVEELCAHMRVPVWRAHGFEFDDLLAHVVQKYRCRFEAVVGLTNDSDLYQLFYASNFHIHKGKAGAYTRRDFNAEFSGMQPADIVDYLALQGTHNAVAGIDGVGPKTAMKAIQDTAKWDALYAKHKAVIERNRKLIALPHPKFPFEKELPPKATMRDPARELYKFCSRYDIEVPNGMAQAFEQVLT